jgi:Patatin-like phospholipase
MFSNSCRAALETSKSKLDRPLDDVIGEIEQKYVDFSLKIDEGAPAADVHRGQIATLAHYWTLLKSTSSCLWCLQRPPEHVLECAHTLCSACAIQFGLRRSCDGYAFDINKCLCLSSVRLLVNLKPPTAEPTVLTVDGGGIRVIVACRFLIALQSALGESHSLRDYFDCAFGTSSGAISVLDHFTRRSHVEQTAESFLSLADRVFPPKSAIASPCAWLRDTLCWWFADSRYDGYVLEETLKEIFGTDRRLFDITVPNVSDTKLGVTATTTTDASLCVFTNYNGDSCRRKDSGKQHHRVVL